MATEGMKLTDFYAASTVCAPSRCSLMTGVHTGHALVRGNREVQPEGQAPLPASALTLPEVLGKVGYVSGMFGKWGLGSPGSEGDPMNQGFDRFYGYNCQRQAHTFYPDHLWSDRNKVTVSVSKTGCCPRSTRLRFNSSPLVRLKFPATIRFLAGQLLLRK